MSTLESLESPVNADARELFGILLVFVIVSEYGSFQSAQKTVRTEATNLAEIIRNTQSFPEGPRNRIRAAIGAYANEVVHHEWKLMRDAKQSEIASSELDGIQHALAASARRRSRTRSSTAEPSRTSTRSSMRGGTESTR